MSGGRIMHCCYQENAGAGEQETAGPGKLCYWHDPTLYPDEPDCARLQAPVRIIPALFLVD